MNNAPHRPHSSTTRDSYSAGKKAPEKPPVLLVLTLLGILGIAGFIAIDQIPALRSAMPAFLSGEADTNESLDDGSHVASTESESSSGKQVPEKIWRAELEKVEKELEDRRRKLRDEIARLGGASRAAESDLLARQSGRDAEPSEEYAHMPRWAQERLAVLAAEVASLENQVETLRNTPKRRTLRSSDLPPPSDSQRWAKKMQEQRTKQRTRDAATGSRRSPSGQDRGTTRPAPPSYEPTRSRPPSVSGCSWSETYNGQTTFSFSASNPGDSAVTLRVGIYFVEHDMLTGSFEDLVNTTTVTLGPGERRRVRETWTVISPEGRARCTVRIQ